MTLKMAEKAPNMTQPPIHSEKLNQLREIVFY